MPSVCREMMSPTCQCTQLSFLFTFGTDKIGGDDMLEGEKSETAHRTLPNLCIFLSNDLGQLPLFSSLWNVSMNSEEEAVRVF